MSVQGSRSQAMFAALKKPREDLSLVHKLCALMLVTVCGTQLAHAERKTTFFHTDGLGSVVAASDQNGVLLWRKEYAPYGEQIHSTAENEKLSYTGKQHDDTTGLTYFGARYYDPQLGRFTSVDPAGITSDKPFTFNRYAYANGNPFKFVDPDGREAVGAAWLQRTGAFFGAMPAPRNKIEAGLALAGVALPFAAAASPLIVDAVIAALANPGTTLAITEAALAGESLGGGSLIVGGAVVTAAKVTASAEKAAIGGKRTFSAADRAAGFEKAKDATGSPRCQYCGKELNPRSGNPNSYEADHTTPYARGGPSTQENLTPSCRTCNRSKGAQTLDEWVGR